MIIALTLLRHVYAVTPWYQTVKKGPVSQIFKGVDIIVGSGIPFIIICTANILILKQLKQAASERIRMTQGVLNTDSDGRYLNRMLILVSVVFIVCTLPVAVPELLWEIPSFQMRYDTRYRYWMLRIHLESWCLIALIDCNHAINFYLYVLGGGKNYRKSVKQLFSCRRCT
jgi:hypothetical protein